MARPSSRLIVQHDLLAIMLLAPLALAAILLDWPILRPALALPYLFFVPGYLLVLALFPERGPRTIDADPPLAARRRLATLERLGLSILASLVLLPLVGTLMATTGEGLTQARSLFAVFLLSGILFGIAAVRTGQLAPPEAPTVPPPRARWSRAAAVGGVLLVSASAVVLAIALADERPADSGPQFYLLGPTGGLRCFPENWNGTAYLPSNLDRGMGCPRPLHNLTVGLIFEHNPTEDLTIEAAWSQERLDPDGTVEILASQPLRSWSAAPQEFRQLEDGDWIVGHRFELPPPPYEGVVRLTFRVIGPSGDEPVAPLSLLMRSLPSPP